MPNYKITPPYPDLKCDPRFMRTNNRLFPIFSDEDADLREVVWCSDNGYACRTCNSETGKRTKYKAHRIVLARKLGRPVTSDEICDHINRNILDNRRENLRLVTHYENTLNQKPRNSRSGARGVYHDKRRNVYTARFRFRGKIITAGSFGTIPEAKIALDEALRKLGIDPVIPNVPPPARKWVFGAKFRAAGVPLEAVEYIRELEEKVKRLENALAVVEGVTK
jgi:hypothetical protein